MENQIRIIQKRNELKELISNTADDASLVLLIEDNDGIRCYRQNSYSSQAIGMMHQIIHVLTSDSIQ